MVAVYCTSNCSMTPPKPIWSCSHDSEGSILKDLIVFRVGPSSLEQSNQRNRVKAKIKNIRGL